MRRWGTTPHSRLSELAELIGAGFLYVRGLAGQLLPLVGLVRRSLPQQRAHPLLKIETGAIAISSPIQAEVEHALRFVNGELAFQHEVAGPVGGSGNPL